MLLIIFNQASPSIAPPATPLNLAAVLNGTSEIDLSWQSGGGTAEDGYFVERSTDNVIFSQIIQVGPPAALTYHDLGLAPNRTYYYRVRAFNAGGVSGYSNVANATTPPAKTVTGALFGPGEDQRRRQFQGQLTRTVLLKRKQREEELLTLGLV